MKLRTLGILVLVAFVVVVGFALGCEPAVRYILTPAPFGSSPHPPAPDYAELRTWAAHPQKSDPADLVPPNAVPADAQSAAAVDVFFVHPTTYYRAAHFNAPWDQPDAKETTDRGVMALQASAFNGAGRIYAPYYRQIALGGYFTDDQEKGLAFAFADVERAFDHWLANWNAGRPFILASHSQGTRHVRTLLEKRFTGDAGARLRERVVAVYAIGGWIEPEALGTTIPVPACRSETDLGCVIGWRTLLEGATPRRPQSDTNLCVNPLNWSVGGEAARREANLGALPFTDRGEGQPPVAALVPELVGARCDDGWLRISPKPDAPGFDRLVRSGDYHIYDYGLFWANIRANAIARTAAFVEGATP